MSTRGKIIRRHLMILESPFGCAFQFVDLSSWTYGKQAYQSVLKNNFCDSSARAPDGVT